MSRATVADCIALVSLPPIIRLVEVRQHDEREEASRSETYSWHACATKKCPEKVRVVRHKDDRPDLCTTCYLKQKV